MCSAWTPPGEGHSTWQSKISRRRSNASVIRRATAITAQFVEVGTIFKNLRQASASSKTCIYLAAETHTGWLYARQCMILQGISMLRTVLMWFPRSSARTLIRITTCRPCIWVRQAKQTTSYLITRMFGKGTTQNSLFKLLRLPTSAQTPIFSKTFKSSITFPKTVLKSPITPNTHWNSNEYYFLNPFCSAMVLANFTVSIYNFNQTDYLLNPKYKAYTFGLMFEASIIEEKIQSIFRKFFNNFLNLFLRPYLVTVVFFLIAEIM